MLRIISNIKSSDTALGLPFNIAGYGLLLSIIAYTTGYTPKKLIGLLSDVHIYLNHIDGVKQQVKRKPLQLPQIQIINPENKIGLDFVENIMPEHIYITDYIHHPVIVYPLSP